MAMLVTSVVFARIEDEEYEGQAHGRELVLAVSGS